MKYPRMALLAALLCFSFQVQAAQYKPGEVLVKFKDGVLRTNATMNTLYNTFGVDKIRYFSGSMSSLEMWKLQEGADVRQAVEQIEQNPMVEYAQPNYLLSIPELKQMPKLKRASHCLLSSDLVGCLANDIAGPPVKDPDLQPPPAEVNPPQADPDLNKLWGMTKIGAPQAWNKFKGDKKFVVAVIDTGVDYNHEDLSFNMWRNPNPTNNDITGYDFVHNDGLPFDDHMHGTHTAGTVGAVGGNGKAISGVAQHVAIMGIKFISADGFGTTEAAIRSIDYAINNGAKVLSNSWGGPGDDGNQALYDSIERAKAKDVLFVVAAGNSGKNNDKPEEASYPAGFDNDNIISVAATDETDDLAFFSNYGAVSTDLGAPGVNIYSTRPGNRYIKLMGTSMACPHVAGAAALIWAANPSMNYKQVKDVLLASVDAVPALKTKTLTGGRLNVSKALNSME